MFETISSIDLNFPTSWQEKLFLTLDVDWAHDEILNDSIYLIEQAGISATWFITHDTPLLKRLRGKSNFELGIHPNFNPLLQGDDRKCRTAQDVVNSLMKLVPEAKSVRSHSMTQSSHLLEIFRSSGLTHDCNHFIPMTANIEIKPWTLWNGMLRIPYFWEDDITCIYDSISQSSCISVLIRQLGLKVFDFHPIHVFLNTEHLARYERTRDFHHNPGELIKHRFDGQGTRTILMELLDLAARKNYI